MSPTGAPARRLHTHQEYYNTPGVSRAIFQPPVRARQAVCPRAPDCREPLRGSPQPLRLSLLSPKSHGNRPPARPILPAVQERGTHPAVATPLVFLGIYKYIYKYNYMFLLKQGKNRLFSAKISLNYV